jgi:hypothetical protein
MEPRVIAQAEPRGKRAEHPDHEIPEGPASLFSALMVEDHHRGYEGALERLPQGCEKKRCHGEKMPFGWKGLQ